MKTPCYSGGHDQYVEGCSGCELGLARDADILRKAKGWVTSEKISSTAEFASVAMAAMAATGLGAHDVVVRAWRIADLMEAERQRRKDKEHEGIKTE